MGGKRYSNKLKGKVSQMRAKGASYSELNRLFHIPKSTLSVWLSKKYSGIFDDTARRKHLARIRILSQEFFKKRRLLRQEQIALQVKEELKNFPLGNLGFYKSFLAALYWAEGSKTLYSGGIKFANTDPEMMALFLSYLRRCYKIKEDRLRVRLHVHYYHNKSKVKRYWSQLLKIPESQFWKTYAKKRSKTKRFRQNFRGICFLHYYDNSIRRELMEICRQLCEYAKK